MSAPKKKNDVKMGRRPKLSTAEKCYVIDKYFMSIDDTSHLDVRGLYAKIAEFAKHQKDEKWETLEEYDFRRDAKARAHIQEYLDQYSAVSMEGMPAFVPLDLNALLSKPRQEMVRILQEREQYFQSLAQRSAVVLQASASMNKRVTELQQENARLRDANADSTIAFDNRELKKQNQDLKRYIRKHLESEMAERFIAELDNGGPNRINEVVSETVNKSIYTPDMEITHGELTNVLKLFD